MKNTLNKGYCRKVVNIQTKKWKVIKKDMFRYLKETIIILQLEILIYKIHLFSHTNN